MDLRLEDRYVVIKLSKLSYDQRKFLIEAVEGMDLPTCDCVVIEEDWPEYTPVVDMLFGRIDREALDRR